jgi:predicted TIM-barrel enzyme
MREDSTAPDTSGDSDGIVIQGQATFKRDDRPEVRQRQKAEQFPLFADVETDQQMLSSAEGCFLAPRSSRGGVAARSMIL